MKRNLKITISVIAVVVLIISAVAYFLDAPFYGYILDFAVPLCFIALYLSFERGKNKILFFFALAMLCLFIPSNMAYATVYQDHGNVGWIYPDGEAWAMVDTDNGMLSFKWSFPDT